MPGVNDTGLGSGLPAEGGGGGAVRALDKRVNISIGGTAGCGTAVASRGDVRPPAGFGGGGGLTKSAPLADG